MSCFTMCPSDVDCIEECLRRIKPLLSVLILQEEVNIYLQGDVVHKQFIELWTWVRLHPRPLSRGVEKWTDLRDLFHLIVQKVESHPTLSAHFPLLSESLCRHLQQILACSPPAIPTFLLK